MSASLFAHVGPISDKVRLRQLAPPTAELRVQVAAIIAAVRRDGDAALRAFAREFDGVQLDSIEVPRATCVAALDALDPALRRAMERSARNLRTVSAAFAPRASEVESEPGVVIGRRPDALGRVGVYVPGGRAAYPSSLLMGAIPARVAGVREVVVCTPPASDGLPSKEVLASAALAGVDRVFAVGGAGAIAALAYGTETVPAVDRIVGPGNAYVAQAKLQVMAGGSVAIDAPAGPSELLIIADDSADVGTLAREVIAQAEHDPQAAVVIVVVEDARQAVSERMIRAICGLLRPDSPTDATPRRDIVMASLKSRGAVLSARRIEDAVDVANEYAAEHVLVAVRNPDRVLEKLRNAGTVFLGEASSVAFGDYMTGANHVLPTGGLARCYSGLSPLDFVRWTTYQRVSPGAAARLANDVSVFAAAEGLPAHADAARAWSET